jgi:hypothetical protein
MPAESTLLRQLFDRQPLSQAEFGRAWSLGTGSMVYQYLSARRPLSLRAAVQFARGLNVELEAFSPRLAAELQDLLSVVPKRGAGVQAPEYARIRCVALILQDGKRRFATKTIDGVGGFIAFRHDWLYQRGYAARHLMAVQIEDDGMQPTLWRGDLAVINSADVSCSDPGVFAVNYEGELRIRRLIRDAGLWWLYCDNPDAQRFPRKQFVEKRCYIIGRIVHRQSESL